MAGKKVAVLWLLAVLGWGHGGKVLVWPADNSHWLNMEYILQELVDRGHEVTVLVPSCFLIFNTTEPSPFQFEVVEVPLTKEEMAAILEEAFYFWFYRERVLPVWKSIYEIGQMLSKLENVTKVICDAVLKDKALMERLKASTFDVLLADPLTPSGELFAEKLGIPFVYTIRFSIGNTVERLCGMLPAPPSYVPATLSCLSDRMSFLERLKNILTYAVQDLVYHHLLWGSWDQYYSDVLDVAYFHFFLLQVIIEMLKRGQTYMKHQWADKVDVVSRSQEILHWRKCGLMICCASLIAALILVCLLYY